LIPFGVKFLATYFSKISFSIGTFSYLFSCSSEKSSNIGTLESNANKSISSL